MPKKLNNSKLQLPNCITIIPSHCRQSLRFQCAQNRFAWKESEIQMAEFACVSSHSFGTLLSLRKAADRVFRYLAGTKTTGLANQHLFQLCFVQWARIEALFNQRQNLCQRRRALLAELLVCVPLR